jgi:hypothetical protein
MNRRQLIKNFGGLGLAVTILTVPLLSSIAGCASSTYTKLIAYINVALQAFESVVSILSATGILPPGVSVIVAMVKAGFADVLTAVNNYNAAPAADKTTFLLKIATVAQVLQNDLASFWSNLNIPNPALEAIIQGLLGIITTTLGAFQALLPTPPVPVPMPAVEAKEMGRRAVLPVVGRMRSVAQFKADWNVALGPTYQQYMLR